MPRRYAPHELVETFSRLGSLPEVYLKIKQAVESDNASIEEIAVVIHNDVGISARILRVVNSPLYGMARRIDDIGRALSVMGMQQVHDIILGSSVTSAFAGMPQGLMDLRRFWTISLKCALAARFLGKKAGLVDSERLFVVGLLSRVGHMVMYDKIPQLAALALSQAQRTQTPLFEVERQIIGCDYAAVGGELLARWHLPDAIVEMIADHLEPELAQSSAIGSAILNIATFIAENESAHATKANPAPLNEYVWEATNLSPETLREADDAANQELTAALELFSPSVRNAA